MMNDSSGKPTELVEKIEKQSLSTTAEKATPRFNETQLASHGGLSSDYMGRKLGRTEERDMPTGKMVLSQAQLKRNAASNRAGNGGEQNERAPDRTPRPMGRRRWTYAEARQWIQACGLAKQRGAGQPGVVITVANIKGGIAKAMTATCLAQGLSQMGYKVLAIDVDPQSSMTSLFGILPIQVTDEMTVLPLMYPPDAEGARSTIKESIRQTYWDGVDLIAGSRSLFRGDFFLPSRQLRGEPNFEILEVLNRALDDGTRMEYDYVIIDTMPAPSYITMNTLQAANALLMPLPVKALDFASSAQYWTMFSELFKALGKEKSFNFLAVVPTEVDHSEPGARSLLKWIQAGYGDLVMPTSIPVLPADKSGATILKTAYEITNFGGNQKTFAQVREAYDRLVGEIDHLTRQTFWR